jgi:nickel/cobalt transporter (NiCoT) family protein
MCLLDTTDGALMMALYTSKVFSRDKIAILYYSIVLTGITILVALSIGIIQVLSLLQGALDPPGAFWEGVSTIGDNFDIIGGSICGLFLVLGLVSVLLYKPWRRRMEREPSFAVETSPAEVRLVTADEQQSPEVPRASS